MDRVHEPRIETIFNSEEIVLTDELLEKFKLQVDEAKIENFDDINFISLLE